MAKRIVHTKYMEPTSIQGGIGMESPATMALKGIIAYLEAHPDDKLDTTLIHKACTQGLEDSGSSREAPTALELDTSEPSVPLQMTLCSMLHDSLQAHQVCPVCGSTEE